MVNFKVVGRRMPRKDALEKVTGEAIYGTDVKLPRMLYGAILRSPYAHAEIIKINTDKAKKIPGVRVVITGEDTPNPFGFFGHLCPDYADRFLLERDKVRFIGDEVAAVAAIDLDTAQEAVNLIEVEYKVLLGVFSPDEAMKPGAPVIHKKFPDNVLTTKSFNIGDKEKGFAEANYIFEETYTTHAVAPSCLEVHQCVANWGQSSRLTVWSTTQMPFFLRKHLAEVLDLPESKVRVIKTFAGGGFGSRMDMHAIDGIAAVLAKKADCPVWMAHNREEEFFASRFRHPFTIKVKTGVTRTSKLTAVDMSAIIENGAYTSMSPGVAICAGQGSPHLYRVDNFSYEAKIVYTNNPYGGAYRGFGNPQSNFAFERHIDLMAKALNLDPIKFRLINAHKKGDINILGHKFYSCGFQECMKQATEKINWYEKYGKTNHSENKRRGLGLAGGFHTAAGARVHGNSDGCGAFIKLEDDGKVIVIIGGQEIGQGANTVFAQIAAEELGVRYEDVHIENTDTDIIPWDIGAHASRTTFICGNAVKKAAAKVKNILLSEAARKLKVNLGELETAEGIIYVKKSPEHSIYISDVARTIHYHQQGQQVLIGAFYDPPTEVPDSMGRGNKAAAYAFAVHAVEVEVDLETGHIEVLQMVGAHDVGKAINPASVEGQIEGGMVQGLGSAIFEELIWEEGRTVNPNFLDYRIPGALDVKRIETILVETDDPLGPFGAKGIGEIALVPTAAAIANAVSNAIDVQITEIPITPEKILKALRERRE